VTAEKSERKDKFRMEKGCHASAFSEFMDLHKESMFFSKSSLSTSYKTIVID
jgi:hypothetical protein